MLTESWCSSVGLYCQPSADVVAVLAESRQSHVSHQRAPGGRDLVRSTRSETCIAVTGVSESTNPSAGCRCLPNARHKFATLGSATPSRSLLASETVCREHAEHSGLLRARTNRSDRLLGTPLQGGDSLGDERLCVHSLIISTVSTALLAKEF
jgi:hypothetical protein